MANNIPVYCRNHPEIVAWIYTNKESLCYKCWEEYKENMEKELEKERRMKDEYHRTTES